MHSLTNKTVTLQVPKIAALVLGLVGGVAQVVNYLAVPASSQLHAIIAVGLYFLIAGGIPPLTGGAFKAALHLPAWANYAVSALLGVGLLALGTVHMASVVHVILAAIITVVSALGFSAAVQPVPVAK